MAGSGVAFTAEQVAALAPDAAGLAAGRKTAAPRMWSALGRNETALWGECQGSAVYQVRIALADLAAKCSCPSRKFPCKHALGLMLLAAEGPDRLPTGTAPEWVTEWLDKRSAAADKKKERAEKTAAAPPSDPEQQAKRAEKRLARVIAGIDALELWLDDLMRTGLASVPHGDAAWNTQAARLVDAQAPGLASRVRRLSEIPRTGDWGERLAEGLGRLALLTHATRRLEALDAGLAADVRSAVGWTLDREDVVGAGERVNDEWVITGQVVDDDDRVRMQRSWLRGLRTGRDALVLNFAAGNARFADTLLPGMVLDAELAYWPSAHPLRALVNDRRGEMKPLASRPAALAGIDAFLAAFAGALSKQPWLDRFPAAIGGLVPVVADAFQERFNVVDGEGRLLPLAGKGHWKLLAVSGGHPVDLFGEWDGRALLPLGAIADGGFHALVTGEAA